MTLNVHVKGLKALRYFVKDLMVHKYPVSNECKITHLKEVLHSHPPAGYAKCASCFPEIPR